MTGTPPIVRMGRLPLANWPRADAGVWTAACNPLPGPFSQTPKRSPATHRMYAQGYAGFLWHLQRHGQSPARPRPLRCLADCRAVIQPDGIFRLKIDRAEPSRNLEAVEPAMIAHPPNPSRAAGWYHYLFEVLHRDGY
jgi:hypothetical protein